ncbi:MAG: squalene/phytoene synthase family protein [Balneolaceae bacterium]
MTNLLKIPYSFLRPFYEKTSFHKGVISELEDEKLISAYSHCRALTRRHAKTFYLSMRFLPNYKQRSMFSLYALCRYLDNLVDESEDLINLRKISRHQVLNHLDLFQRKLIAIYEGVDQEDPVLEAFSDTLKRHYITLELPLELISGVKMDLEKDRFQNFDELYGYSYKVAASVGLMSAEILGYRDPNAATYAEHLGIAMQLTNVLRDIGEDLTKGRIYLPKNELKRFGIDERELFAHEISDNFIRMMKFQINRARGYYQSADRGISMLSKDSRLAVSLARENYSRILDKIEENNYDVFRRRAFLNFTEKMLILPKIAYRVKF